MSVLKSLRVYCAFTDSGLTDVGLDRFEHRGISAPWTPVESENVFNPIPSPPPPQGTWESFTTLAYLWGLTSETRASRLPVTIQETSENIDEYNV